ncbi:hypothetical protein L249_7124 [Ophiocordyceps polyrhachis-furcata BCC 54312]|uniref:Uncharacterized protein n=1 Tax=Ophiocordyceps polyrhachis-furcata BCC 54312 TaxID=1330021 RepID=A0A367LAM1_9HYPO|nr:hypothetical protein L249_7124 [Ophiocordyceps polyrhachis-furcata BCC 54312]
MSSCTGIIMEEPKLVDVAMKTTMTTTTSKTTAEKPEQQEQQPDDQQSSPTSPKLLTVLDPPPTRDADADEEQDKPPAAQQPQAPTPPAELELSREAKKESPPAARLSPPPFTGPDHDDAEVESELSEPGSNVASPPAESMMELEDEIVVGDRPNERTKTSPPRGNPSAEPDQEMQDVRDELSVSSHYPKRKRTSLYSDLSETKIEISQAQPANDSRLPALARDLKSKSTRQSLAAANVKGVLLGHWRDSAVTDESMKHAVYGFIDSRDRLRTRIQPQTKGGKSLVQDHPLPPGAGATWVTFDRVVLSPHLANLDQLQIKEYTRIRLTAASDETDQERKAAEAEAAKEAVSRVKDVNAGSETPDATSRPDAKRRKVSGGYAAGTATPSDSSVVDAVRSQTPPHPIASNQTRFSIDPLPGTRPTRILLGFWRPSSEVDPKDRHAVYGILGQNDMFRVKVVRETRDGRFVDGNFPSGAGALWIPYEEVEFDQHLARLSRQEIKEFCRIRQFQIDHGETEADRADNETKAVQEAQTRAAVLLKQPSASAAAAAAAAAVATAAAAAAALTATASNPAASSDDMPDRPSVKPAHELRQSRRIEPRPDSGRNLRQTPNEGGTRSTQRLQGSDAVERTSALARREISRVEAIQGRVDRLALSRERAVAAATDAASAAAAAAAAESPAANGRTTLFHESEDMQRLNKVWARQESLRMKAGAEDVKIYDGVKYERKSTGPFMGKLVSQGAIINIEGEDYVEYRVLTKPSFF